MREYVKPEVKTNEASCEGVYAASGEGKVCRFGRTTASKEVDICQSCSATGGTNGTGKGNPDNDGKQYYEKDYVGCPDNMPEE